ncbi:MAG: hypothetical protein L0211_02200 [Planctomycetaceae bacterium]|nr:hypothetical protein [Planctomycetaceae bacterium]
MPAKQFAWLQRIKDVEREHAAMRLAADRLLQDAARDPSVLTRDVRMRDVDHAAGNLEGTYIVRIFAEFETGVRNYWVAARGPEPPKTRDLLESIAARRGIPHDVLAVAHSVRMYRNNLVHEREEAADAVALAVARSGLCKFFARLPLDW